MNKFIILSLLFTSIFAAATKDDIFERVVYVLKGMAKTEAAECAEVVLNNKDTFIAVAEEAVEKFNQGEDFDTILKNALFKVIGIDGFFTKCNLLTAYSVLNKFNTEDGLREIVQTVLDNFSLFYSYFSQVLPNMKAKEWNTAAENVGHFTSVATNFQVE